MEQFQRKKPNHVFFLFLLPVAIYIGYSIGKLGGLKVTLENLQMLLEYALFHPLPIRITSFTGTSILVCVLIWLMAYLSHVANVRNYKQGIEYGSARMATYQELNEKLQDKVGQNNKIISENLRIGTNSRKTEINNHALIVGGSGAGKSFYMVMPNGLNCVGSYVFCDPKGELLRTIGNYLKMKGYRVVVLNLVDPDSSDRFNPFRYIRTEKDIITLITNLIANTTKKEAGHGDPFWESAETMYLQAIFTYVWIEHPKQGRRPNFAAVLELLNKAKVQGKEGEQSELDKIMFALPEDHPALITYKKVVSGAADTIRSIIITANARLAKLQNPKILRILEEDDIHIPFLGQGVYENPDRKMALFCVTPDSDSSYNFIVGMLYTQVFQELYYVADQNKENGGRLNVPVAFWMDEFANTALPEDFVRMLATMRGREISCNIIIQNLAQLKTMFKESWETLTGNCDTLIYLGGNEQGTHKYVSELLGKQTIDKKATGETLGNHGSSSRNYDVLGRDLLSPDEVRMINNKKCLVFVKGYPAVYDDKYRTWEKQEYKDAVLLGPYVSDKEMEMIYEEERITFYTSVTGSMPIEKSLCFQIEQYGGVFEESPVYKELIDTPEGYKRSKENIGSYMQEDEIEIHPAFSFEAMEFIRTSEKILKKHRIVGWYEGSVFHPVDEKQISKLFCENTRITPLMRGFM